MYSTVRYALVVSLFALASAASPARAADPVDEGAWTGKFAYVGGDSQKAAIRRAIEAAISDMGPLTRHVARLRLAQETKPDPRLRIVVDESTVGVAAQQMWRSPLDGSVSVVRDSDGDAYRVSQRFRGNRLFQVIRDESLVIRNVFALSADGKALDIRVEVQHERIPEPLAYRLTYRRVE